MELEAIILLKVTQECRNGNQIPYISLISGRTKLRVPKGIQNDIMDYGEMKQ